MKQLQKNRISYNKYLIKESLVRGKDMVAMSEIYTKG
jgi:hypothetical protein